MSSLVLDIVLLEHSQVTTLAFIGFPNWWPIRFHLWLKMLNFYIDDLHMWLLECKKKICLQFKWFFGQLCQDLHNTFCFQVFYVFIKNKILRELHMKMIYHHHWKVKPNWCKAKKFFGFVKLLKVLKTLEFK